MTEAPCDAYEKTLNGSNGTQDSGTGWLLHYRIRGLLGAGGMGEVLDAEDTKLGRRVAIKRLLGRTHNEAARHRFRVEARVASALRHPAIVAVYAIEELDGEELIIMELVEGRSLDRVLTLDGPLPIELVVSIGAAVADALAVAHDAGILHRDVKPANILLDAAMAPKLFDFGVAKSLDRGDPIDVLGATRGADLSSPGALVGTPAYMPIEQIRGEKLDERCDVFALGCVLYEAATGSPAFARSTLLATISAVATETPPPVSTVRPGTPPALDFLIARMLSRERAARPTTMRDVKRALLGSQGVGSAWPRIEVLPMDQNALIGREHELDTLGTLLASPLVRLVTLTGTGGTGKTRIARSIAERASREIGGEWVWIDLSGVEDASLVPGVIADAVGAPSGPRAPLERACAWLGKRRALLVLDNFEQVIAAAPALGEILAQTHHVKLLVTSRALLHLYGEHEFAVPPLGLPDLRSTKESVVSESLLGGASTLFLRRARALRPEFGRQPEELAAVAELVVRLDGLPLAIELAAARVRSMSALQLLEQLGGVETAPIRLLTLGSRDLPARQRTLRSAIAWSYDRLDQRDQCFFRALGVFSGGFTIALAAEVATSGDLLEAVDCLDALIDASLVHHDGATGRHRLLETLRAFALEEQTRCGEDQRLRECHARALAGLLDSITVAALPPRNRPDVRDATLLVEHENVWSAARWALGEDRGSARDLDTALRLAAVFIPYLSTHRGDAEADRLLVAMLARVPVSTPPSLPLARFLHQAGNVAFVRGELARAEVLQRRAIGVYRLLGDRREVCDALAQEQRSVIFQDLTRGVALADELTRYTVALMVEFPDDLLALRGRAHAFAAEGWVAHELGDAARGIEPCARALAMFRDLGDIERVCVVGIWFGEILRSAGLLERALACYEESVANARRLATQDRLRAGLINIAFTCVALENPERARLVLCETLVSLRGSLGAHPLVSALVAVSATAVRLGSIEAAARILGASRALAPRQSLTGPDRKVDVDVEARLRVALGGRTEELIAEGRALSRDEALVLAERTMGGDVEMVAHGRESDLAFPWGGGPSRRKGD